MTRQGLRAQGRQARPGGEIGLDDIFLGMASTAVSSSTNGNVFDMSRYEQVEVIAFHTAESGTPTRLAVQVENDTVVGMSSATVLDGELQIVAEHLSATGAIPVSQVYDVDPDRPFMRAVGKQAGGTNGTLTILLKGIGRKFGNRARHLYEGTKVAAGAAAY